MAALRTEDKSQAAAAIIDLPTALLALISAVVLIRFELNSVWLILAGAFAGLVLGLR